jgi:hypothetical protein
MAKLGWRRPISVEWLKLFERTLGYPMCNQCGDGINQLVDVSEGIVVTAKRLSGLCLDPLKFASSERRIAHANVACDGVRTRLRHCGDVLAT